VTKRTRNLLRFVVGRGNEFQTETTAEHRRRIVLIEYASKRSGETPRRRRGERTEKAAAAAREILLMIRWPANWQPHTPVESFLTGSVPEQKRPAAEASAVSLFAVLIPAADRGVTLSGADRFPPVARSRPFS